MRLLARLSILLGWLLLCLNSGMAHAQTLDGPVVVGKIDGTIDPVMAQYVSRVVRQANDEHARAVVFEMDTPGGLEDSMRSINQAFLASDVPTVVYVAPNGARAASAGMYICYAADLVGMTPTSNIGSATPVSFDSSGNEQQMTPEMQAKVENDAVAQVQALAQQHGRNADWAEQAIRQGSNLQASDALAQGVTNYVAPDLPSLLRQMDGTTVTTASGPVTVQTANVPTEAADMSPVESFLFTVTDPTVAYLLLSLGSLGILVELYNPGSVFPGVIGGIALLLALFALGTLPLNFAGLALMAFGLVLFGLEPFLPTHGILAVGGAVAFAIGSSLLIDVPPSESFLRIDPAAIAAVTLTILVGLFFLVASVVQVRRRRPVVGREALLGVRGVARTSIGRGTPGLAFVDGVQWRAVSAGPAIESGEQVVVEQVDGITLVVGRALGSARAIPTGVAPVRQPAT